MTLKMVRLWFLNGNPESAGRWCQTQTRQFDDILGNIKMKGLIRKMLAVAALLSISMTVNAEDVVILRTGEHVYGKLRKMTVTTVSFESRKTMFEYPLKDVYAVKSDSRGDIFYNMKGERISRPANNEGRGADRIYLIDGEEIIGWKTAISGKTVSYQDSRETKKNRPRVVEIPVEKVFMINYFDGTKEIVNDITTMIEEDSETKEKESPLKVVFHDVVRGESVVSVAEKYNVSVSDLREWNDLSPKIKDNVPLTPGRQFMIYVKQ